MNVLSVESPSLRGSFPNTTEDGKVIISNSEVSTFLSCERKHYYGHGLGLAPKKLSDSLSRGIIGHEALAAYYENDCNPDKMFRVVDTHAVAGTGDLDMLTGLRTLLSFYVEHTAEEDAKLFDILEVEKAYYMDLGDEYSYGMRLDLLVQMKAGPYMGEKIIVDHKFLYNFMTADELSLNVQLPKYIGTLRNSGHDVKRGMLNQLRWRVTKANEHVAAERFRRDIVTPSAPLIRNIMKEQVIASEKIADRKAMGVEQYGATALRSINSMTCKNCSFSNLCSVELNGEDASVMIQTEFEKNTYGYSKGDA